MCLFHGLKRNYDYYVLSHIFTETFAIRDVHVGHLRTILGIMIHRVIISKNKAFGVMTRPIVVTMNRAEMCTAN